MPKPKWSLENMLPWLIKKEKLKEKTNVQTSLSLGVISFKSERPMR